jgi:hypothetical protein
MIGRRLTDSQFDCLWGLSLGSRGSASNKRTLESLHSRGLATVRMHQGEMLWEASAAGEALIARDERSALLLDEVEDVARFHVEGP